MWGGRPIQRCANIAPDKPVRFRSVRYAGDKCVGKSAVFDRFELLYYCTSDDGRQGILNSHRHVYLIVG